MATLDADLNEPGAVAIVGPTASGKSALAIEVCRGRGGEIVSCDSVQVYRGLDIGSGKATSAEQALVRHHLIDILNIDEQTNAATFAERAAIAMTEIGGRGRLPVLTAGTGLYLTALLRGLFEGGGADLALRGRLDRLMSRYGELRLHRLLARKDPEYAARTAHHDRIRVVRALEVCFKRGRSFSAVQRERRPLFRGKVLLVGLAPSRVELRRRVIQRVRGMLDRGLVDEVRRALAGRPPGAPTPRPLLSIGYREVTSSIAAGAVDAASDGELQRAIVTATMQYAKRQMTYFRRQFEVEWFEDSSAALDRIHAWVKER